MGGDVLSEVAARRRAAAVAWLAALALIAGCARPPAEPPAVGVRFELDANHAARFRARLKLANRGPVELGAAGWALYFNLAREIMPLDPATGAAVTRVDGDLWRLEPLASFAPLGPGGSRVIDFVGRGHLVRRSDAPRGFYLVWHPGEAGEAVRELTSVSVAPFREPAQTRRGPDDLLEVPTPASRYRQNLGLELLPEASLVPLVPTPRQLRRSAGEVVVDDSWSLGHEAGLESEAAGLAEELGRLVGGSLAVREGLVAGPRSIRLRRSKAPFEHYRLTVDRDAGIELAAGGGAGIFYAGRSLLALAPPAAGKAPGDSGLALPEVEIEDGPRFPYRGLHLDVARNFQPKEAVLRLIDLAAFYKLNRLHLHLADDEGWRLEVPALPELTAVGGRRGHTLDEADRLLPSLGSGAAVDGLPGSGYYTGADYVEILRYARARHVRVVPEIDLPGHARAAVRAMEARSLRLAGESQAAGRYRLLHPEDRSRYRSIQGWTGNVVDVCLPSTYRFVELVVDEVVALYRRAEAPLDAFHIGGDEVPDGAWEGSPACARLIDERQDLASAADLPGFFFRRVIALLEERGLATAGWEEIALRAEPGAAGEVKLPDAELATRGVRPYVWNSVWGWGSEDLGYRLANAGFEVVLSNASNLYFDLAYEKHPEEPGLDWGGFVDTRAPWELVPLDLYRSARIDRLGRPVRQQDLASHVRLEPAAQRRVRGLQGQLWGENLTSPARLDYMAFPKLLGLAERAWAPAPGWAEVEAPEARRRRIAAAWNEFANRLGQRELPRLDFLAGGVGYRLPPPGAVVEEGRLRANSAFPGLEIRWMTGTGGVPAAAPVYEGPVAASGPVSVATFDRRGRSSRPSVVAAPDAGRDED